ncbi:MAG: glutathione S-transferase N-terminal domain-containing protein [Pseudomonadota bacterium]
MTYDLALGNYAYSSWSLRAWLLFEHAGIPARITKIDFASSEGVQAQLGDYAPARTVPALRTSGNVVLSDSLAIAEHLAEAHPEAALWPACPIARATSRNLATEMHAGFQALRDHCPMNLFVAYTDVPLCDAVRADLLRLDTIWQAARIATKSTTPWLCGAYSVADAFYAPVAARIAGYDLPVSADARAYVAAHLSDPAFRRWRAMARAGEGTLERYTRDYPTRPWPGPVPRAARAVENATPENAACPYSGKPATDCLEIEGRVLGFCNPFCRDKTVADPEAWPAFSKMLS